MIKMKNFLRLFYYLGKEIILDFSMSFWTLLYPILMSVFFFAAFNNIDSINFENIPVAVIENSMTETMITHVPIFDVIAVENEQKGLELVKEDQVTGFITNEFNLHFAKNSGIRQTIIKNVANQMKRVQLLGIEALKLDFSKVYIKTTNQQTSSIGVLFYSLLASVCFSAVYTSIGVATSTQPNLSQVGARLAVSPIKKVHRVFASFLISMALNILANLLLVVFIYWVLNIQLFHNIGLSLLLLFIGNFCATLFGFAISYSSTWKLESKLGVMQAIVLSLSAFAGMMGPFIRHFVDQRLPIINKINPIAIITNEMYRINVLNNTSSFIPNLVILMIFGLVSGIIAYYFLRGERYDSI